MRCFELNREEFTKLIEGKCYYCGDPPQTEVKPLNGKDKSYFYNGIDRVDNFKGYSKENVVSCCKDCNFMKKEWGQERFLNWIKKVYEWRIK